MPTEYKRTMHLLRVKLPDDSAVDVPLIDEIWFKDEQENSQRYHFIFRNRKTEDGVDVPADKRTAHTVEIASSKRPAQKLICERIDTFKIKFPQQRSQTKTYVIRKGNAPPIPRHLKTHNYDVHAGEGTASIKMQRIDKLKVNDAQENGQEKTFVLDWKRYENVEDLSTVATMAPSDNDSDSPWRFDPFQNPIDFTGGAALVFDVSWIFKLSATAIIWNACTETEDPFGYNYLTSASFAEAAWSPVADAGVMVSGSPALDPASHAWTPSAYGLSGIDGPPTGFEPATPDSTDLVQVENIVGRDVASYSCSDGRMVDVTTGPSHTIWEITVDASSLTATYTDPETLEVTDLVPQTMTLGLAELLRGGPDQGFTVNVKFGPAG